LDSSLGLSGIVHSFYLSSGKKKYYV